MLVPKIREVRHALSDVPEGPVFEVHPETSFAVLAGGPLAHSKRDAPGHMERVRWLTTLGLWPATGVESAVGAGMDDILDALAAAWTAHRIVTGEARCLGDPDARDPTGFRLTIWA
jgi:predicted RNase H-like nuclease